MRKHGSAQKFAARVLATGHECDLAVLTVDDDAFWGTVEPLSMGGLPAMQEVREPGRTGGVGFGLVGGGWWLESCVVVVVSCVVRVCAAAGGGGGALPWFDRELLRVLQLAVRAKGAGPPSSASAAASRSRALTPRASWRS